MQHTRRVRVFGRRSARAGSVMPSEETPSFSTLTSAVHVAKHAAFSPRGVEAVEQSSRQMTRKTWIAAAAGLLLVASLPAVAQTATPTPLVHVALTPSPATIANVGATANVNIAATDSLTGTGAKSYSLGLTFDPSIVQLSSVQKGDIFLNNCTGGLDLFDATIDNVLGHVCILAACQENLDLPGSNLAVMTFQGQAVGSSAVTFSPSGCAGQGPPPGGCQFNEGSPGCSAASGEVDVLGPTSTPTNTPTSTQTPTQTPTQTSTSTPSNTPTRTLTPSPTNTVPPTNTQPPTSTPTQTATVSVTPTLSPSSTPTNTLTPSNTPTQSPTLSPSLTATPTSTPTQTPTPSNTPTRTPSLTPSFTPTATTAVPVITPLPIGGDPRVCGRGAPNVGTLQIFDAGANHVPGGGDDVLIGTGGTDASGSFNDGQPCIAVTALVTGDFIFAVDVDHDLTGPTVQVQPQIPVPTLNPWGTAVLGLSLGLVLGLRTWLTAGARKRSR